MPDILDLQNEYNTFWQWMSTNIEKIIDESETQKRIIDNLLCKSIRYSFDITDLVNICLIIV